MRDRAYRELKGCKSIITMRIFWIIFLISILCVSSSTITMAGDPAGGKEGIHCYNFDESIFSVVWQVDTPSTYCTVKVYKDINGQEEVSGYQAIGGTTDSQKLGMERGVLQVDVTGLSPDPETLYVQTISRDAGGTEYPYPPFGDLVEVKTEPGLLAFSPQNGLLKLMLYDQNGINPQNPTENLIEDGIVAIIYAKGKTSGKVANNPISWFVTSGWPNPDPIDSRYTIVEIDLGLYRYGPSTPDAYFNYSDNYWRWESPDTEDHELTIVCLGGLVPGAGKGQRVIRTDFTQAMEGNYAGVCLDINDTDACFESSLNKEYAQIVIYPNRSPTISLEDTYHAEPGVQLTINVCASDPDPSDTITGIYLDGNVPSGMLLTVDPGDPNCATITWTPSDGGFYRNIQVKATDGVSTPATGTFVVIARPGPPTTPQVAITPEAPYYTMDQITCNADPNTILNPDPNDTVLLDFQWYRVGSDISISEDTNVILDKQNPQTYTNTLDPAKTQKDYEIFCRVTAHDKDGSADPANSNHVSVLNSPPSASTSQITPLGPVSTTESVTCSITEDSTDADDDTITYRFVWTETVSGKTYPSTPVFSDQKTNDLPDSETLKGETWKCTVTAKDTSDAEAAKDSDNTVDIINTPPNDPESAEISPADPNTTHSLICEVTPAAIPDVDPGDIVWYKYIWSCPGKSDITSGPKPGLSDTLSATSTMKADVWTCTVWAVDDSGAGEESAGSVQDSVTIMNSPPTGLAANITPAMEAYIDTNLVTQVSEPTDPDTGDTFEYRYVWNEVGGSQIIHDFSTSLTDQLSADNTLRGQTWYCIVTARDNDGAEVDANTNMVSIVNRPPSIDTTPSEEKQIWDEGGVYTIRVTGDDLDGDDLIYEIDTNYTDPDDPQVQAWLQFDPNGILTANPPTGSSGVYQFNFIVKDVMGPGEDAALSETVNKLIEVQVQFPAMIIDDFEYPPSEPKLSDNGWYWVQGSGQMLLKQEDAADPNSNHYLQTKLTTTPSNNSQIDYMITKLNIPPDVFTYPELHFDVLDTNKFYFEAYVRAVKGTSETNYFLRYVPNDPKDNYTVSGKYVTYNIGSDVIDPNGIQIKEIVRNMDEDLFNATQSVGGYHYKYLKGIILRGDLNYLDNIKVSPGREDRQAPYDVINFTATKGEQTVYLEWDLDPNQMEDIAGYRIYMSPNVIPTKDPSNLLVTVAPDKTDYAVIKTVANTDLVNGITYNFIITAVDTSRRQNESPGKSDFATPELDTTPPLPPEELKGESQNRTIILSWKNPTGQAPDLFAYEVYYDDCTHNCLIAQVKPQSPTDPNERFELSIVQDKDGNRLALGDYKFIVNARDNAKAGPNYSADQDISVRVPTPPSQLVDDFEYEAGVTLMHQGWYRLLGSGSFTLRSEPGNHYLRMVANYTGASSLNYMITKWLANPEDYTNPEFSILIRSAGYFRIDVYMRGSDGKNYWVCYQGDPASASDSGPVQEQSRWYVYKLGWAENKTGNPPPWAVVSRNLDDDLMNAKPGVQFEYVLGLILRGTMDIDNIELLQGLGDAENLTARPADASVLLSWSVADPNIIDTTKLYVDGNQIDPPMDYLVRIPGTNDYQYNVTNLTNDTAYEFKVALVIGETESRGTSIQATPRAFQADVETFTDVAGWTGGLGGEVTPTVVYDSEVQSDVMYVNPNHVQPERFSVSKDFNISSVTNMSVRIKSEPDTNFIIWVEVMDDTGLPFWLGLVPGGTQNTHVWHGWFAYYYLGPGYTDGKWHYIDKNLDNIVQGMLSAGLSSIESVSFGGKIWVDDLGFY